MRGRMNPVVDMRRIALGLLLATTLAGCGSTGRGDIVPLRILAFNDFHGQIQSEKPSPGRLPITIDGKVEMVEAGGAAYLSALVTQERQGHANHVLVSAGDLTGASPLVSALLQDEPTIQIMNHLGLDLNVVGNHEFDYGRAELLRKARGDCDTGSDCAFAGAEFDYLAANVIDKVTGQPLFRPYAIREFDGVPVGFIGVVTAQTPHIVAARGIRGLTFLDEVETLNRYAAELRALGVAAIVALLHEGATPSAELVTDGGPCQGLEGALTEIVAAADPSIDLFISGHTHQSYACRLDGRLVTQTASYGRMLSVLDLNLVRATGEVATIAVDNKPVTRDLAPDPTVEALIAAAEAATAPIRAQPVAELPGQLLRTPNANGESALGDVIADAHLVAGRLLGAQIAFTNPGGIRQDLPSDPASSLKVTVGDLFAAQPFGNNLVAMDLTGAQLKQLLEQQWIDQPADRKPRMLQLSHGFTYCFDDRRAEGDKILSESMLLDGAPMSAERRYRIIVNSFLADGGDRFTVLKAGLNRVQGDNDLNALRDYLVTRALFVSLTSQNRICRKS
jgi:5'-nucleotidase